jgi:hypothetical protein
VLSSRDLGTRWEKELAAEVCFRLLRFRGMLRWAGIWVQAWPIVAWQAGRADTESLITFSYFSAEPCRPNYVFLRRKNVRLADI